METTVAQGHLAAGWSQGDALVTVPIPKALWKPGHRLLPIRALLELSPSAQHWEQLGESLLAVRNVAPSVKASIGLAQELGPEAVFVATQGDVLDTFAALSSNGLSRRRHLLPLFPGDVQRTQRSLNALGWDQHEGSSEEQEAALRIEGHLKEQKRGRWSSREWVELLMNWSLGTPPAPKDPPRTGGRPESRIPIAVIGHAVGGLELYEALDALSLRVCYHEWGENAASLTWARDAVEALALNPILLGVRERRRRWIDVMRGVRAIIVLEEPFCALSLLEHWVREVATVPVLTINCETVRPLDPQRRLRLEAFARSLVGRNHT